MSLEKKCVWKEVAERDEKYSRSRMLPEDSICHPCDGYNNNCDYYVDNFPTTFDKIPRNSI